jgi:hypothetical protein
MTGKFSKLIFFISVLLTSASCEKEPKLDTETQSAIDFSLAEPFYTSTLMMIEKVLSLSTDINNNSVSSSLCANLYVEYPNFPDTISYPRTLVIDFASPCLFRARSNVGKVKVTFNQSPFLDSTQFVINFEDFFISNDKIEGEINGLKKNAGEYLFSISNGKISIDTKTISFNTIEDNTFKIRKENNVIYFSVEGKSAGTSRDGLAFKTEITSKLEKTNNCNYTKRGYVEITPENLVKRTINYGDGTCDTKALVSTNGYKYDFDLR